MNRDMRMHMRRCSLATLVPKILGDDLSTASTAQRLEGVPFSTILIWTFAWFAQGHTPEGATMLPIGWFPVKKPGGKNFLVRLAMDDQLSHQIGAISMNTNLLPNVLLRSS